MWGPASDLRDEVVEMSENSVAGTDFQVVHAELNDVGVNTTTLSYSPCLTKGFFN